MHHDIGRSKSNNLFSSGIHPKSNRLTIEEEAGNNEGEDFANETHDNFLDKMLLENQELTTSNRVSISPPKIDLTSATKIISPN